MMKRINLIKLFSRFAYFDQKCCILPCTMPTSYSGQNRNLCLSKVSLGNKVLDNKFADTFGNIENFNVMFERVKEDPEDIVEYEREKAALGKNIRQYIEEIKELLRNYDYKSAIKVLEVDMVNDRKRVVPYIYKILINYNAKSGDLEEAYRLFLQYKKRNGFVTGAMYTCLFNACANCKNSLLAVEKANAIAESMRNNKNHTINTTNYNVMLKAYGRHGDLPTCLKIMDEVLERRDKVHCETYCFLVQSCISDKNSGLRHALIVWRKMIQNRVKPDIYIFNMLLKCVHDCSLGDTLLIPSIMDDIKKESGKYFRRKVQYNCGFYDAMLLKKLKNFSASAVVIRTNDGVKKREVHKIPSSGYSSVTPVENQASENSKQDIITLNGVESIESSQLALEGNSKNSENCKEVSCSEMDSSENQLTRTEFRESEKTSCESAENLSCVESSSETHDKCKITPDLSQLQESELPNLIALEPTLGSVVEFGVMTNPHHRFLLLGGLKGFLKTMAAFGVKPDIKTFTLLMSLIPPNKEAEEELISITNAHELQLDTGFFNVLLRRRVFRKEESNVKECLEKMYSLDIKPDLITFKFLALTCYTQEQAVNLLETIRNHGYRPSINILDILLEKARWSRDLNYVLTVVRAAKEDGTHLNQKFISNLSEVIKNEQLNRRRGVERDRS